MMDFGMVALSKTLPPVVFAQKYEELRRELKPDNANKLSDCKLADEFRKSDFLVYEDGARLIWNAVVTDIGQKHLVCEEDLPDEVATQIEAAVTSGSMI